MNGGKERYERRKQEDMRRKKTTEPEYGVETPRWRRQRSYDKGGN